MSINSSKTIVCLIVLIIAKCCTAANILYLLTYPTWSHYVMLKPVGLELARRGHNVTVITGFKENDPPPSYHQVVIDGRPIWDFTEPPGPSTYSIVDMPIEVLYDKYIWRRGVAVTEMVLNSTQIREFLAKDNSFDIVISQQLSQEAMYILAHKYSAPLVLITTFGNSMKHNFISRNPLQLATVLFDYANIDELSSFLGRLTNLYYSMYEYFWWRFWHLKKQEELVKKYLKDLPEPVPSLYEVQKNVSLFLINSHFSFDIPVAYLPNVVEIGGAHLARDAEGQLPEDLQRLLDNAKHGVVYFSFGSYMPSSHLPKEKKDAFLKVFGRLKETVLWKWEDDKLEDKTNNVVTRKWFPQKYILSHPNVKLFVSHGGLIGTQEAINNGVPIVGVPLCSDQYKNLKHVQLNGVGRMLHYHDLSEKTLGDVINDVLNNGTYRMNARELSIRFKDRPMTGLDTAVFWIEYVIRNKGAGYMKNPARELSWIANNMVDVYAFILLIVFLFIFLVIKILLILKSITRMQVMLKEKRN